MNAIIQGRSLELTHGDITAQRVDAIVNAANSRLAGGGGVDGAIHRAGGAAILEETRTRYPAGCPTGSAVISGAGKLSAKYVIHAVGPVWRGGMAGEETLLALAYRTSLQLAASHDCQSIALPALSTGAYGYPLDKAAKVALATARDFLTKLPSEATLSAVRFVLFSSDAVSAFERVLTEMNTQD